MFVTPPVPVTITVETGPRQTFAGVGASIFPWTPARVYNAEVTPDQTRVMARLLWRDAGLRSVRLWIHPGEEPIDFYVDGYVGTGKLPAAIAAGAKDLILAPDHVPERMSDGHGFIRDASIADYAQLLAGFIRDFRTKTGILINYCGVLNEPNDRPVKFSDRQWPVMVKSLRTALDARGLQRVAIVAPESANCGDDAYKVVDSLKADGEAWRSLGGVATHSYNNAATEAMADRALSKPGKPYWITEAGGITDSDEAAGDTLQAASAAARFLNDTNHGVTNWQFFIGAEEADPRGNTGRILKYNLHPFRLTVLQKYWYLRQLTEAFPVGAVFRHSVSSLDGEMTYAYGKKPHVNASVARTPGGEWSIGLSNFTSPAFSSADDAGNFALHNSGYAAQDYAVTVRVPELGNVPRMRFAVYESRSEGAGTRSTTVLEMHRGVLVVPDVAPVELVTLRSIN